MKDLYRGLNRHSSFFPCNITSREGGSVGNNQHSGAKPTMSFRLLLQVFQCIPQRKLLRPIVSDLCPLCFECVSVVSDERELFILFYPHGFNYAHCP